MDVTRENFEEIFPEFEKNIENAAFISMDTELTGLIEDSYDDHFDHVSTRYLRYLHCSMNYIVPQLGICAWVWQPECERYICHAYNFYIFPHSRDRATLINFLVDSSSIDFLAKNHFDFNKVFYHGVSYIRRDEYNEALVKLEERLSLKVQELETANNSATSGEEKEPVKVPEDKEAFLNDVVQQFREFMETCLSNSRDDAQNIVDPIDPTNMVEDKTVASPVLTLSDKYNSFERKLVYDHLLLRCPEWRKCVDMRTRQSSKNMAQIVITFLGDQSEVKRKQILLNHFEEKKKKLESLLGITKVIEAIAKRAGDAIVVTHHGILDIMHLIHHFLTPLPEDYAAFKLLCLSYFGRIIDTKHMATNEPFKDEITSSSLESLLSRLEEKPFSLPSVDFPEGGPNFNSTEEGQAKFHDAAFDAFVTGQCFLSMLQHIEKTRNLTHRPKALEVPLAPYVNKLHLFKNQLHTFYDILHEEDINQAHVQRVFLCQFPNDWNNAQLEATFQAYNSPNERLQVFWTSSTSAWVRIQRTSGVDYAAVPALSNPEAGFRVCPYVHVTRPSPKFTPTMPTSNEEEDKVHLKLARTSLESSSSIQDGEATEKTADASGDGWQKKTGKKRRRY